MPKILVTAQIDDPEAWEKGFRTHEDLFRRQTVKTIEYSINGNQVAVCADPADFDAFMELFEAADTKEAMEYDGVQRDTVQVFIMDNVWDFN